uniref:DEAD/DEAH box helicase n=1 Tax=uncultured Acinetobacter sp. TaxID=165433 RepID=UPI002608B9CC|nr:DEAD/DEAH box helicase [uncultured Acinetobacter sp.]
MSKTFADFPLAESLQLALQDLGFTTPTPVQEQSIPAALEGKDLLVSSQTGSGKTAAFLLPTLNALSEQDTLVPFKERMRAVTTPAILVLCPTRELAQQVCQDAIAFVRKMKGVRVAAIMGGMPFAKQIQQLKGAQVVVATPGRLLDLVNRRQIKLDKVNALIVDEADRMLDLGFSEDLEAISDLAGNREQTLMFSATFADRIISLAERMMNSPERIAIETGHTTNTDVTQTLHWTDGFEHKKKLLTHWLNDETLDQAVVFASTQEDTDMLAEELAESGLSVVALHGAMPQSVRNRRLRSIREGKARILVATDVAARGLDVPTISHVINFGLPMKNEDYVHRVGRTGRAGRTGQAVTLATYRERGKIRALEEYLETRLNVSEIEGLEPSPPPARPSRKGGKSDGRRGGGRGDRGFGGDRGGRSFGGDRDRGFGGGKRRIEGEGHFKREERSGPRKSHNDYINDVVANADFAGKPRSERPRSEFKSHEDDNRGNRKDYQPRSEKRFSDRGGRGGDNRGEGRRFDGERKFGDRSERGGRDFGGDRPKRDFGGDRPSYNDRQKRDFGDRPERSEGRRFDGERKFGDRSDRGERNFSDRPKRDFSGDRPKRDFGGERPSYNDRPKRDFGRDDNRGERREFSNDRPRRQDGERSEGRRFGQHDNTEKRFSQEGREHRYKGNGSSFGSDSIRKWTKQ